MLRVGLVVRNTLFEDENGAYIGVLKGASGQCGDLVKWRYDKVSTLQE